MNTYIVTGIIEVQVKLEVKAKTEQEAQELFEDQLDCNNPGNQLSSATVSKVEKINYDKSS